MTPRKRHGSKGKHVQSEIFCCSLLRRYVCIHPDSDGLKDEAHVNTWGGEVRREAWPGTLKALWGPGL